MPATDRFNGFSNGVEGPASFADVITPNNSVDLTNATRGLYIGISGDVKVDMLGGSIGIIFTGLTAGIIHPLRVTRVYSTGTTATNIVGVY